jgi:hypothetical protein
MLYPEERPPSDDTQHLPFILVAVAVVKGFDRANPSIVSDRTMAICFMAELPFAYQALTPGSGAGPIRRPRAIVFDQPHGTGRLAHVQAAVLSVPQGSMVRKPAGGSGRWEK